MSTMSKSTKINDEKLIPVGYKLTDAGIIPEDWEIVQLKDVCFFENGDRSSNYPTLDSFVESGIPFINAGHISEGTINQKDMNFITYKAFEKLGGGKVQPNDILFCLRGSLGKFGVIPDNFGAGAIASSLVIIRIKQQFLFLDYLVSGYLKSSICEDMIELWAGGAAQPNLGANELGKFSIPLPSISEQKSIANVLSDTDALITALEQLIAKKQAIKTASMQQLLTGRTRLPKFAKHPDGTLKSYKSSELGQIPVDWEVKTFGEITKLSASRINPKIRGGGDLCIELEHIQPNTGFLLGETITTCDTSLKNTFEPGDILFGKLRSYLKKYWFANISGVCSTEFWVFKPEIQSAISKFIYYIVQTDNFIAAATEAYGTHMPRADWKVVKDYQIMLPGIEEQTAIAAILSDMDADLSALEKKLAKVRDIKQGMMQQLLTGRIRLPLDQQP